MRRWTIGGLAAACLGLGAYLWFTRRDTPAPAGPPEPPVAAAPAPPPGPVVLARVVEVADLDPLLDPPERPATGTPFDPEPATVPTSTPAAPDRIPPAVD